MTTVASAPGLPQPHFDRDSSSLSALSEPQNPGENQAAHFNEPSLHPDLSVEVAALSNKLITSINQQTELDDALAATRQELELMTERARRLEYENKRHNELVSNGQLVPRSEVEGQASKLLANLAEERKKRTTVEKDKKGIEQELENLTTALFEEANEMVAAARKEQEASDRRNDQLKSQIRDTESLVMSQQEQLSELKTLLQQVQAAHEENEIRTRESTAPTTPTRPGQNEMERAIEALHLASVGSLDDVSPAPPTTYTYLLSPVLRLDTSPYDDFRSLIDLARKPSSPSRVNSGSYGGVSLAALSTTGYAAAAGIPYSAALAPSSRPETPSGSPSQLTSPTLPLKETRFYKRILSEDLEPTLRLDIAPGLSWLARRNVISSICDGTLVVEPVPSPRNAIALSCTLCGENRREQIFARSHRFRTSESDTAQKYPLCPYCLNRVRASCDFMSFLRQLKDGHWRAEGSEGEKAAWEESVRLRERMFWARVGGGVVPSFASPREPPKIASSAPHQSSPLASSVPISREDNEPGHAKLREEVSSGADNKVEDTGDKKASHDGKAGSDPKSGSENGSELYHEAGSENNSSGESSPTDSRRDDSMEIRRSHETSSSLGQLDDPEPVAQPTVDDVHSVRSQSTGSPRASLKTDPGLKINIPPNPSQESNS